ncbi:nuclear transport factor 2 family protein [Amycolatopsis sp. NPDC051372]
MTEADHGLSAVARRVLLERRARDRGQWGRMRDCIHPEASIRLSWFQGTGADFVKQSEEMAARGQQATHRLAPPVTSLSGTRAVAEVPASIEFRDVIGGVEADLASFTRLVYRLEKTSDTWRIVALDVIYERDTLTPVMPGEVPDLDRALLSTFRAPCRFLGYHLADHGYTIWGDLYGVDRPEPVAEFYHSLSAWVDSAASPAR